MAEVKIRAESCKACGYCIKFCPKHVIEFGEKVNSKGYEYAVVANEGCVGCCMCAVICPDAAIEVL